MSHDRGRRRLVRAAARGRRHLGRRLRPSAEQVTRTGAPPEQPVGAKLELTYRCNLRCGFCYTDSPRKTVEGALDLSDADWRRIADEVIDLGAIEVVLTGGEPLLR